jgi:hypothetical protein
MRLGGTATAGQAAESPRPSRDDTNESSSGVGDRLTTTTTATASRRPGHRQRGCCVVSSKLDDNDDNRRRWPIIVINALIVALLAAAFVQPRARPVTAQTLQTDPRPTIYSGQISFGLLLSAHSSPGAELSTAASSLDFRRVSQHHQQQQQHDYSVSPPPSPPYLSPTHGLEGRATTILKVTTAPQSLDAGSTTARTTPADQMKATPVFDINQPSASQLVSNNVSLEQSAPDLLMEASDVHAADENHHHDPDEDDDDDAADTGRPMRRRPRAQHLERRQIFERPSPHQVRRQQQQQQALELQKQQALAAAAKQQQANALDSACSQVNPNALYAGMGAIWASHQANLVGDSQLAIGTYVYDSCNDLEIGQRQSVRIVSNLNAFQQTTCESPRGSPISLTIAHGENQLRAIQLLTSFRVPVITTKEPFALEDYHLLTRDQRRFLFSTAPSSRHLATGALKFTKRVVSRSAASSKLPNQYHKMSSKNGLIVISRNLPAKFIAHLAETIPNHVNYEMLQTNQPIDQVRSIEALESLLMLNGKQQSAGTDGAGGHSSTSAGASTQESRVAPVRMKGAANDSSGRRVARSDDSDSAAGGGSSDSDSDSGEQQPQQHRMLSPTILMFITPSEAIDLVTRLRNDLAEVSRYYSLVVTTREDISPALRTIFHRGGSRLCSGKAFYTISPKPDEVHEFSRYFRDTVQMEGESSDHPLICEFAKHQAGSRTNADLDDISTEAVIKAVWSAAAAFKLVHKRECSAALGSPTNGGGQGAGAAAGNLYTGGGGGGSAGDGEPSSRSLKQGRRQSQTVAGTSGGGKSASLTPHAECLVKMNKNMSNLVQRALKKLDVHINSTGLQALDGFRIKFDESNELLTNKFSIKYINKECEITELGQYSGTKDSQLYLDEDVLLKSLESTLPDPWPIPPAPAPVTPASSASSTTGANKGGANGGGASPSSSAANSSQDEQGGANESAGSGQPDGGSTGSADETASSQAKNDDDQDSTSAGDNDKQPSIVIENESPKRRRSNAKLAKRKIQHDSKPQQLVSIAGGRARDGLTPGLTDYATEAARAVHQTTTPITTTTAGAAITTTSTPDATKRRTTNGPSLPAAVMMAASDKQHDGTNQGPKSMRKLKPFPEGKGVALSEWLPKQQQQHRNDDGGLLATTKATVALDQRQRQGGTPQTAVPGEPEGLAVSTTRPPSSLATPGTTSTTTTDTSTSTTTTLPESGGNTDLDMPAFKTTTTASGARKATRAPPQVSAAASSELLSRSTLDTAASTTTELTSGSDYVTLPSIARPSTHRELQGRYRAGGDAEPNATQPPAYAAPGGSSSSSVEAREPSRIGYLRDLNSSPIPLPPAGSQAPPAPRLPAPADAAEPDGRAGGRSEQRNSSRSRLR